MTMVGSDPDALEAAAAQLDAAAAELDASAGGLHVLLGALQWIGKIASAFVGQWNTDYRPRLGSTADFIRSAADELGRQAEQQRNASFAVGAGPGSSLQCVQPVSAAEVSGAVEDVRGWLDPGGWGVSASDLDKIHQRLLGLTPAERRAVIAQLTDEELARLGDQMNESLVKGGFTDDEKGAFLRMLLPSLDAEQAARVTGHPDWGQVRNMHLLLGASLTAGAFGSDLLDSLGAGHRGTGVGAMAQDEIEIRKLANGQFVVVLPGVVDLREGIDGLSDGDLGRWEAQNAWDSARDMHYARRSEMGWQNGSATGSNAYALAVKDAMFRAGVPEGAPVMLVGHSFGAYTALEMASDPTFNDAMGGGALDPTYHVNVTHVLAAGANAGFRLDDLPSGTRASLINSNQDAAVVMERAVPTNNGTSSTSLHNETRFDALDVSLRTGHNAWDGVGHEPSNYGLFVGSEPASSAVSLMLRDAIANGYGDSGQVFRVVVKDPYR
jgi:hypothetical protein